MPFRELWLTKSLGLSYSREAKLLCKKIVAFFSLLSKTQETGVRKLGVTQELLSLVTGLAHYLKLLIRICLQGALKVEVETQHPDALNQFLDDIGDMEPAREDDKYLEAAAGLNVLAALHPTSALIASGQLRMSALVVVTGGGILIVWHALIVGEISATTWKMLDGASRSTSCTASRAKADPQALLEDSFT